MRSGMGRSARGIAVVQQNVIDAELKRLADAGVTGVRLNLATARRPRSQGGDRRDQRFAPRSCRCAGTSRSTPSFPSSRPSRKRWPI
jgi:hypothetical protein